MSTIGVEGTASISAMVERRRPDVLFLDAPVSGSKVPAEEGKLTVFASGAEEARSTVEPVFGAIGQRTVWLGPTGMGSRMKLVNNTLLAFSAEGVAYAVALAHQLGIEVGSVWDAFEGGRSCLHGWPENCPRLQDADYSPSFHWRWH